jgi:hypothetical protein
MGQSSFHISGIAAQFVGDGARWRVPIKSARASSNAEADATGVTNLTSFPRPAHVLKFFHLRWRCPACVWTK